MFRPITRRWGICFRFNPKIHSLRTHSKEFCRLLHVHRGSRGVRRRFLATALNATDSCECWLVAIAYSLHSKADRGPRTPLPVRFTIGFSFRSKAPRKPVIPFSAPVASSDLTENFIRGRFLILRTSEPFWIRSHKCFHRSGRLVKVCAPLATLPIR